MLISEISLRKYLFIIGVFLSLIFASLVPSGSEALGYINGFIFWSSHMLIGFLILVYVQKFTLKFSFSKKNPWNTTFVSACIGAFIFSFPAYYLDYFTGMPGNSSSSIISLDYLNELGAVFIPVVSTWMLVNMPWLLKLELSNLPKSHLDKCSNSFLDEAIINNSSFSNSTESKNDYEIKKTILPSGIMKEDVIAISSELHYLRVYTLDRQYMILGSMKDLLKDFDESIGIQTHRSYWASKAHFKLLKETDQGIMCELANSIIVPVSRRKKKDVLDFFNIK